MSHLGGGGGFVFIGRCWKFSRGSPEFFWATFTKYKIFWSQSSSPVDWHPCWVVWLKGGGLGAWLKKGTECPQVGRGGVYRQITSNWFQTCSLRIALCISCMIEVRKCFGKGFGWICALKRRSVQERAQTNYLLPYCSSGNALFGLITVQADSCLNSEQIDTLFISVGGQEEGFGGWVVILGRRPKIWTCLSTIIILNAFCRQTIRLHSVLSSHPTPLCWFLAGLGHSADLLQSRQKYISSKYKHSKSKIHASCSHTHLMPLLWPQTKPALRWLQPRRPGHGFYKQRADKT